MKTVILYGSKYQGTKEIVFQLKDYLPECDVYDLKSNVPDLSQYDLIIIGSGLYAGKVRPEVKGFIEKNMGVLLDKKIALFVVGMSKADEFYFTNNFPEELLQKVLYKEFLGGRFDSKNANFFERLIMKVFLKTSSKSNISSDAIKDYSVRLLDKAK